MSLGIVVVEICGRNLIASLPLEDLEAKYPEVAVMRTDCLNLCNLCRARPYAMVNDKRVHAQTPEQCMELIEKTVQEEIRAFYEA